jgi:hypothetical protein
MAAKLIQFSRILIPTARFFPSFMPIIALKETFFIKNLAIRLFLPTFASDK